MINHQRSNDPVIIMLFLICTHIQAKTLVVDMGFLLEGKSKASLPEVLMGTVRLINIDFKTDLRVVEDYKP